MTVASPDGAALLVAVAEGAHGISGLLVSLVAVFVATRLLGELAQRIGQPAVLGELIAGVLLGGSVLGLLDPTDPVIAALSEIGVIVLLFAIGLHTDIRSLVRVGRSAVAVGLVGVALPFAGGYWAATALGVPTLAALVCGAGLTATSIGISARVLSDLGELASPEGQIVLGAAVLDDVVGLIILTIVGTMVAGGDVSTFGIARTAAVAIGFVVAAVLLGGWIAPPLFRAVERIKTAGALGIVALAFAFAMAALAVQAGSALIIGAFAAGLVLHDTTQRAEIEEAATTIGYFFVPIFFASVGAAVELSSLASRGALLIGGTLIAIGILGKVAAGFAPFWFGGRKLLIGVAMVPRGEVGLIFAQLGLASGVIRGQLFGALMLMVLTTTFITPPLLGLLARRRASADDEDQPGQGGIDDLVAGTSKESAFIGLSPRARYAPNVPRVTPEDVAIFRPEEPGLAEDAGSDEPPAPGPDADPGDGKSER
ncbi:MAG TPA: cation:proton antiporter [Gemmatimonadaceae bacterium]